MPPLDYLRTEFSYDHQTGVLTRLRTGKPAYLERKNGMPVVELFGRKLSARKLALGLYLGRYPERHEFHLKSGCEWNDIRFSSFQRRFNDAGLRTCYDCGDVLDGKRQNISGSAGARCHTCFGKANYVYARRAMLKSKYKMTESCYNAMLNAQGGVCKICLKPEENERFSKLSVDHCHKTGHVRGLLCSRCNTSIGKFKDDPALLLRAAKYLLHKL
jgi:hypothetical protein